uniref:G_PROTEIN_RECEP_F1_2 domain-containing protein n=1 Tax=Caenorhabditis tropicalis TaxID=1561998 RepID=A0A1I7TY79_9PELO
MARYKIRRPPIPVNHDDQTLPFNILLLLRTILAFMQQPSTDFHVLNKYIVTIDDLLLIPGTLIVLVTSALEGYRTAEPTTFHISMINITVFTSSILIYVTTIRKILEKTRELSHIIQLNDLYIFSSADRRQRSICESRESWRLRDKRNMDEIFSSGCWYCIVYEKL